MPIDYSEYPDNWHEISRRIRQERAGNRCESCGVVNGVIIKREPGGRSRTISAVERGLLEYHLRRGNRESIVLKELGLTKIVLTVAHLNHIKSDVRDENLKALCQACHLRHDIKEHVFNRRYGRKARENNYQLEV